MSIGRQESKKVTLKLKPYLETHCHTATAHGHASCSALSIGKGRVKDKKKRYDKQPTSMKEIPTLQTSAWMPYCSPDILSGCRAKTIKSNHVKVHATTQPSTAAKGAP